MNGKQLTKVCVTDIIQLIEDIAPLCLSEEWDNCGLQVGSTQTEVKKIWVALDPLKRVITEAGHQNVDMLITHHPLIFRALKRVDLETQVGNVIATAIMNRMTIYAAHTNLDSAVGGLNDVLAKKIGLRYLKPLMITQPVIACNSAGVGMGRIGELSEPMTVIEWVRDLKKIFKLKNVKVAGNTELSVHRAAVCSGSGASVLDSFLKSDAQVFISGDLRYHDARAVEDAGRAFIDIGHFASEHIMIDALVASLKSAVQMAGWDVQIEPCKVETDPFEVL